MNKQKRYSVKKILLAIVWLLVGAGTTILLAAAMRKTDLQKCKDVEIKITGIENVTGPKFIDEDDILLTIQNICSGNAKGKSIGSFDLLKIETELEKSKWVKNAELYFDNNNMLTVNLQEREPVARVFTTTGTSFYIDTALAILPLSDKFPARLPVFTGFPSENIVLSHVDSSLLKAVRDISLAIQKDSFRMAMIDQVDITAERNFEMIPKIGNQLIVFGNAVDVEEKFNKLQLFYKNIITKIGWSKYSVINVQFKNQVVAKIKGAEEKTADSLRTIQIMQIIAANAAMQAEDSVQTFMQDNNSNTGDSSIIQQSIQREDHFESPNTINNLPLQPTFKQPAVVSTTPAKTNPLPIVKPAITKPAAPHPNPVKKTATAKPAVVSSNSFKNVIPKPKSTTKSNAVKQIPAKPKVVMPNKNDYTPVP